MIIENIDLNNALRFCDFITYQQLSLDDDEWYFETLAIDIRSAKYNGDDFLTIQKSIEDWKYTLELLRIIDTSYMHIIEYVLHANWSKFLSDLGVEI
ncbi:hypothetical protein NIES4071_75820 [Calothrix sp. NIES-4071]|nr:hypothetical protein NIES4071_75820 [Calothrix sp. NIES-4071]BAZ61857.1 hypothetical protein NIES4105_75770 [Calothrix sp. NIES-4105]